MTSISQGGIWYAFSNSLWFHSMHLWQKTSLLVSGKVFFVCSCIALLFFFIITLLTWNLKALDSLSLLSIWTLSTFLVQSHHFLFTFITFPLFGFWFSPGPRGRCECFPPWCRGRSTSEMSLLLFYRFLMRVVTIIRQSMSSSSAF